MKKKIDNQLTSETLPKKNRKHIKKERKETKKVNKKERKSVRRRNSIIGGVCLIGALIYATSYLITFNISPTITLVGSIGPSSLGGYNIIYDIETIENIQLADDGISAHIDERGYVCDRDSVFCFELEIVKTGEAKSKGKITNIMLPKTIDTDRFNLIFNNKNPGSKNFYITGKIMSDEFIITEIYTG